MKMRFRACAVTALFLMSAAAPALFALEPGRARNGVLRKVGKVHVLRLWGTPRERGVAHGDAGRIRVIAKHSAGSESADRDSSDESNGAGSFEAMAEHRRDGRSSEGG